MNYLRDKWLPYAGAILIVCLIWQILVWIFSLEPITTNAILALIGAFVITWINKSCDGRIAINKDLREYRAAVYEELLDVCVKQVTSNDVDNDALSKLKNKLALWASENVIEKYDNFNACSQEDKKQFLDLLVKAIRSDLGNKSYKDCYLTS